MSARFEICRTDDGYFARFVAANNRIVWVTPGLLSRRRTAVAAIETLLDQGITDGTIHRGPFRLTTEVRDIDLRDPEAKP